MGGGLVPGVPVWFVAAGLPLILVVALIGGSLARWLLRGRAKLRIDTTIVLAMLGTAAGLFLAGLIDRSVSLISWLSIGLSFAMTVFGIAAYAAVAAHFQGVARPPIPELLTAGESDQVEFKSTARVNLHTGAKDARMEHVIAKTVSAFLNSDGGTLLIGVDDDGRPLGLAQDYGTLKSPDADRFELWLRDLLTTTLGHNAASMVHVDFADVPAEGEESLEVCRVACGAAPRPAYLRIKGAAPELWVRSGNSTRRLNVDEASEYVAHRWPLGPGSTMAAQVKAAIRFSGQRA